MRPIKCREHKEIFEVNEQGRKQWIENWDTYLYLGYKSVKDEVDIVSLDKLKDYPVGDTKKVTTVTQIVKGKEPRELFYPDEPEVEIRKISILGTCLPGCESMMKDLNFTHAYGNRYYWPDYDEVERLGMKSFINIRADEGELTETIIRERVNEWKNRYGCGGYWCDQLGHEPDICNQPMEKRIWFYDTIRKYDPDKQNHPVMEMFDMTRTGDFPPEQHQGWELAWSDETHDLMLVDCYPDMRLSDAEMIAGMTRAWDDMINKYAHKNQVIIQMIANEHYQPGKIWVQHNFWKEKMASAELDNPYRGNIGVCFYQDITIRPNEEMQQEIKQVNMEVAK